ncbi:MAG: MTH1187 family thiamine-binding protein [Phycisphaerae bacterium]|nr:MTH1187 family thiamine-binding protein [Phycisphaerae bacterium]
MAALVEFSIWPLGQGESVGAHVARSLEIIDDSGLPYRTNPMGTVVEGEWPEVFGLIQKCFERMSADCDRVTCTIKVDWRKGHAGRLTSKTASVEQRLGRTLRQ